MTQAMLRIAGLTLEQTLIDAGYDKARTEPIMTGTALRYIETRLTVNKHLILIETRIEDDAVIYKLFAREIHQSLHVAVLHHALATTITARLESFKHDDQANLYTRLATAPLEPAETP